MVDVVHKHDEFGRSPIHYAAANGDIERITRLLANGAQPGVTDAVGFTPLHFAAQEQHPEAIEVLLAAGADLQARDRWGNTPLWRAVFTAHGDSPAAAMLMAAGADPNLPNTSGVSARTLAARMGLTI